MIENRQSHFPAGLMPARDRAFRLYGRLQGLIKGTGSRIEETTQSLIPGLPRRLSTVQRANHAALADIDGFSGFMGSDTGWARTEYGEHRRSSIVAFSSRSTILSLQSATVSRASVAWVKVWSSAFCLPISS